MRCRIDCISNTYLLRRSIIKVVVLSSVFLGTFFTPAPASVGYPEGTDQNRMVRAFFMNLYDFSFYKADSVISLMENTNTDRPTLLIVKADIAWWRLLSGDEMEKNMKICSNYIDESIKTNLRDDHPDINTLFNIIYSYSLKVRLENYKGNSLSAFINFYKSSAFIEKCRNMDNPDEKFTLVLGMYYYFISYIQHKYFFLDSFLFSLPEGDRDKGINYLTRCSGSADDVIRTEADYFLMKIYSEAEKDFQKALYYAREITVMHPDNPVYSVEELKLVIKTKRYDEARMLRGNLIKRIENESRLNDVQKEHFISQIEQVTKHGLKK
ncbi:MAG TPA: hypothetical protein VJ963_07045 [Bacteroidales bacterium]|nr:hypothetical protein [Bacteroidales bacterium]